ncbi:MAG: hypothetical protein IJP71_06250 [Lachnospiraceae bacterium]|nr:hypothetical protein [Lachnospiraceae bacterium]
MMTSEVLYGRTAFRPYFDMQKFEDSIYNRVSIREKRISRRRKLRIVDKLLAVITIVLSIVFLSITGLVAYRSLAIKNKESNIKKLEKLLEKKVYDNKNAVISLKNEMRFDDIKMIAYLELNMITPTEKNIIHFDKSDNGFVRQYENIR